MSDDWIAGNYEVTEAGCWRWLGYMDRNGYGRVAVKGADGSWSHEWVHRTAYRLAEGEIPPRHDIDHTCQNTACVNPDHLEAVTRVEHTARTLRRLGKDNRHLWAACLRNQGLTYAEIAEALGMAGGRVSAKYAVQRAIEKGLISADEVPPARRLTSEEREDIRDLYAIGVPHTVLGEMYGVHATQVSRICSGKRWKVDAA